MILQILTSLPVLLSFIFLRRSCMFSAATLDMLFLQLECFFISSPLGPLLVILHSFPSYHSFQKVFLSTAALHPSPLAPSSSPSPDCTVCYLSPPLDKNNQSVGLCSIVLNRKENVEEMNQWMKARKYCSSSMGTELWQLAPEIIQRVSLKLTLIFPF